MSSRKIGLPACSENSQVLRHQLPTPVHPRHRLRMLHVLLLLYPVASWTAELAAQYTTGSRPIHTCTKSPVGAHEERQCGCRWSNRQRLFRGPPDKAKFFHDFPHSLLRDVPSAVDSGKG